MPTQKDLSLEAFSRQPALLNKTPATVAEGVTELDLEFRCAWLDSEAERLLDEPSERLLGSLVWDRFPEASQDLERCCGIACAERRTVQSKVFYAGRGIWLQAKAHPIRGGVALVWRDVTGSARECSERRRQTLALDQVHDSIICTDMEGNINDWNHGAEQIFGYHREEVIGKNVAMLYFEEDRGSVPEKVFEALKRMGRSETEMRNRRKSGQPCFIRLCLSRLKSETGVPFGMMGVAIDITEQRLSEQALRQSEERYRGLADALPQIAYLTDATGTPVFVNRKWAEYTGRPAPIGGELNWSTSIHPEDAPALMALWTDCLRLGAAFETEYRVRRFDGEFRWNLSIAIPLRDASGQIYQWAGTLTDIHERKIREQQRENLERETLHAVLENLDEGIFIGKPSGTVLLMNKAAEQMCEVPGARGRQQNVTQLMDLLEAEQPRGVRLSYADRPLTRALRGESFSGCITFFRDRRTGREWIGNCASKPVRSEAGELMLAVLRIQDITIEHQAAEEIEQANGVLRALSGQLLKLQDEERRRIARELHDGAVQVLSAAGMYLNFLADSEELSQFPSERRVLTKTLDLIRQSTTDLRSMSYILHPPALDELGLAPALKSWVEGFSERTGIAAEIEVEETGARLTPEVETALFRITQEALANVHRHSQGTAAAIHLAISDVGVELEIRDDGCGFDAAHVFSNAAQIRLGVGLPGMRERARLLGGTLAVTSNSGGTMVRIALPRQAGSTR